MSGTVRGGQKTALINKARYGEDYYKLIGRLGGRKSRGGGFTGDSERARINGSKGGVASGEARRNK